VTVPPINQHGMSSGEAANIRSKLWDCGYRPVAVYSWDHPDKTRAGKAPLGNNWTELARQDPPNCLHYPPVQHAMNTGVLCDRLRAFDIDVDDADLAAHCRLLIIDRLGDAPRRYRGNSGRSLLLLRAADGEPRKIAIAGRLGKIEVLGRGQQFVAHGYHPSGAPLEWFPEPPWSIPLDTLPTVSEAQVLAVLAELATLIEAEPPGAGTGQQNPSGVPQADALRVAAALGRINNSGPANWEWWNRVGMACWRATGGSNLGFEAFDHWSQRNPAYSAEETTARWQHYFISPPNQIGAGTILHMAGAAPEPASPNPPGIWNPWENPPPPQWPAGILPAQIEDALANLSLRDGVDLGALAMTAITAASAAAPKNARFVPYNTNWAVPPVVWLMTIGESGSRKTLLEEFGFCVIRVVQLELWRPHNARMQDWRRLPPKERGPKPEEPHSYLLNDYTPEALQAILARTTRGTAIVKDELAGFLEFDRYKRSGGSAARAFFLSAYEDKDCPVHRIGRDSEVVEHTGLTVFGNIQPRRLATFLADMETDGLLQRFVPLWVEPAKLSRHEVRVGHGLSALYDTIRQLCHLDGRRYTTTPDGAQLISDTETLAREYAALTDFGLGWPGFCHKLHGTHARLALVLHLMEQPDADIVPTDTVQHAHRLVHRFVLQHAHDFYSALPGRGRSLTHDIASWLLTRGTADPAPEEQERLLASDLTAGVKACRPLGSKAIGEALDPFVTGGWLVPENDYPSNRAWFFNPAIRCQFATQTQLAREQRAEARALIARIQAQR
jgi:hypothetical protein